MPDLNKIEVRPATPEEADILAQTEMGFIVQSNLLQAMNKSITDGVIVCAMARVLGRIIAHHAPESRESVLAGMSSITREYINIEAKAYQEAKLQALKMDVAGNA